MYRQGDVLIVPVADEAVPSHVPDAPKEPRDAGAGWCWPWGRSPDTCTRCSAGAN
jgi:hypothetical protein